MKGCKNCPAFAKCTLTYRGSGCAALRSTYGVETDPEINAGLSAEKVEKIISMVPPGTKLYKNKILGLRGRATGLVFNLEDKSIITAQQAQQFK